MVTFTLLNQRGQEFNLRETIERYITDTNKAKSGYIAGKFVNNDIVDCMDRVARLLGEEGGAKAIHFELSFGPEELTDPELAREIAEHITIFIGQEYQACFAVHENTEQIHIHFVFNSLSYLDGYRYTGTTEENLRLADYVASVLYYCADLKLDHVFRSVGSKYAIEEPYKK